MGIAFRICSNSSSGKNSSILFECCRKNSLHNAAIWLGFFDIEDREFQLQSEYIFQGSVFGLNDSTFIFEMFVCLVSHPNKTENLVVQCLQCTLSKAFYIFIRSISLSFICLYVGFKSNSY